MDAGGCPQASRIPSVVGLTAGSLRTDGGGTDGEPGVIEELHIRGLGVIEDSSLSLGPGLTVVTGETGAGKTLLVTALQLLLGARASGELVRRGRDSAVVEALVRAPQAPPARGVVDERPDGVDAATLDELWALAEDGVLIVSREIPAEGRSRARVAGRLVPNAVLGALMAPLIEVHGQHEHIRLERPAVQRALLDAHGDGPHREALDRYRAAHADWAAIERRSRLIRDDADARAARLGRLRGERDEIAAVRLDPDTDEVLDQEIDRLAHAEALQGAIAMARDAAGASGALDGLGAAVAALRRAPIEDPVLVALGERLTALSRDLSDVVADLAAFGADVEADDDRLDALQRRKREVTALQRRYGASVAAVLAHAAQVEAEIADLESLEGDAEGLDEQLAAAAAAREDAAASLTAARRATGERLAVEVATHLGALGLAHATLAVDITERAPGPDGADHVELLLAANPGEPPARLADAASGGERSRVALALEVVLSSGQGRSVLVFDEVDAGIGGATALAVGEKMARLAHEAHGARQVLCVTHLAQVAAYADAHHVVEKRVAEGRTVTSVRSVPDEERPDVLSRMLGGDATAGAGLEHARGLLRAAREQIGA